MAPALAGGGGFPSGRADRVPARPKRGVPATGAHRPASTAMWASVLSTRLTFESSQHRQPSYPSRFRLTRHRPFSYSADRIETRCRTRSAASPGFSCSQIRTTSHPAANNRSSVSLSRRRLVSILLRQNSALCFGQVPCSGQPCQKHPSTKTATFARVKTMSTRRRGRCDTTWSTRYRKPIAWRRRRSRISADVSRWPVCDIRRLAASEDGGGESRPFIACSYSLRRPEGTCVYSALEPSFDRCARIDRAMARPRSTGTALPIRRPITENWTDSPGLTKR